MYKSLKFSIIGLGFSVFAFITLFLPNIVFAGGTQTDKGTIAAMCYDPSPQNTEHYAQILTAASSKEGCSNMGLVVIEPGQPVPRPVCVNADKITAVYSEATRASCTQNGGTLIEGGQQLTVTYVGEGKNNEPTREPITNEERDALVDCNGKEDPKKCLEINPLVHWTLTAINFLAAGVGVIVTIMIIIGGIQYASAGPNPQAVQSAKKKITNAIIALIAFFFLYAFMQYLIPGGIF